MTSHAVLVHLAGGDDPEVELVVIAGAGGGPSYFRSWTEHLPSGWRLRAVCLPGREHRGEEPFCRRLDLAAREVATALETDPARTRILFGHSLGAFVALEAARLNGTATLVATAACAPPAPGTKMDRGGFTRSDAMHAAREMLAELGIQDEDVIEDLAEYQGPLMHADMLMLDGYSPAPIAGDCALVAYYGVDDDVRPLPWDAYGETTDPISLPGGHDFPRQQPKKIIDDLAQRLPACGPARNTDQEES